MEPRLIETYRVGGGYKTIGATETKWQFGNHEIRKGAARQLAILCERWRQGLRHI